MTAYTASQSGLASAASTWGGAGHPSVNGDTFSIGSSFVVDWDIDLTGLSTGLGACVNNGTIQAHRAAGTYGAKRNGVWSGTGIVDCSDGAGGAYAGGQIFILIDNASFTHTMSGVHNVRPLEPVHKFVKLSQAQNAADTVMHIDTDLTGEPTYWKAGDRVCVCNINQGVQIEEFTISGTPTSTTLTLSGGLANSKLLGAYIVLMSRNVRIYSNTANQSTMFSIPGAGSFLAAEWRNCTTAVSVLTGGTIGGTHGGGGAAGGASIGSCASCVVNSVIVNNGAILTINTGCTGLTITTLALMITATTSAMAGLNHNVACNFVGCGAVIENLVGSVFNSCNFIGCTLTGSTQVGFQTFINCVFSNFLRILQANCDFITFYNCLFSFTGVFFFNSNAPQRAINGYVESFDHNQVAGAYLNSCKGGTVTDNSGTVYPGRARSYQHALTNDTLSGAAYSFKQETVLVPAGGWINATCFIQKDASMAYLPRVQIFDASKEPLISGSADAETQMTNSTNTWEVITAKFQNTATYPRSFKVRVIGQNASGNVFEDTDISISPFGFALGVAS